MKYFFDHYCPSPYKMDKHMDTHRPCPSSASMKKPSSMSDATSFRWPYCVATWRAVMPFWERERERKKDDAWTVYPHQRKWLLGGDMPQVYWGEHWHEHTSSFASTVALASSRTMDASTSPILATRWSGERPNRSVRFTLPPQAISVDRHSVFLVSIS